MFWRKEPKLLLLNYSCEYIFRSARTSYRTFDVCPSARKKNPDHLYSLINHRRTTVNLSKEKKGKREKGGKGKKKEREKEKKKKDKKGKRKKREKREKGEKGKNGKKGKRRKREKGKKRKR